MSFELSQRSVTNLQGVHPDLVRIVEAVIEITPIEFIVIEGLRTPERQKQLLVQGKSQVMNSKHLTGRAIDFMAVLNGTATWDLPVYKQISDVFKQVSAELKIPIQWGGDWPHFKDSDHIELV